MKGNPYIAEGIGTFALVFAGCGAVIANDSFDGALGHTGISLASGHLEHLWIYLVAPVLGMLLAYPACRWIQGDDCCSGESEGEVE